MKDLAEARGLPQIVETIDQALRRGKEALDIEFNWANSRDQKSQARGQAALLDNRIDQQISALESIVSAKTIGDDGDPVVNSAEEVMSAIFPRGVAAITNQSFEVQLGIMDTMIRRFDGPFADILEPLGIEREVARLKDLVEKFRHELNATEGPQLTYDQVRGVRTSLHEHLALVVVQIIAAFPGFDEMQSDQREALLAPLNDQQERVAESRSRRRNPVDVDPETGEEVVDTADTDDDTVDINEDDTVDEPHEPAVVDG